MISKLKNLEHQSAGHGVHFCRALPQWEWDSRLKMPAAEDGTVKSRGMARAQALLPSTLLREWRFC